MFLKFESQDERREYGGSCFVEFQFCMMPEGTQQDRIFHSIDHWRDDSLYVHGDSPLFSIYKEILGTGIHPNMTEGYFDYYGVTYYAPDKIEPIIGRLLSAKPEGYDVLNKWLEKVCTDPTCSFCAGRPETPYEVYWREKESPSDYSEIKKWRRDNYSHKENGKLKHEKKRIL